MNAFSDAIPGSGHKLQMPADAGEGVAGVPGDGWLQVEAAVARSAARIERKRLKRRQRKRHFQHRRYFVPGTGMANRGLLRRCREVKSDAACCSRPASCWSIASDAGSRSPVSMPKLPRRGPDAEA